MRYHDFTSDVNQVLNTLGWNQTAIRFGLKRVEEGVGDAAISNMIAIQR